MGRWLRICAGLAFALTCTSVTAEEKSQALRWPQFRGVDGAGVAAEGMKLPAEFGPDKHVVWKMPVPAGTNFKTPSSPT